MGRRKSPLKVPEPKIHPVNKLRELKPNFIELTTTEYGRLIGISAQAVKRRCEQGLIDAYRTEGGHWKVKLRPDDLVSREEAEALRKENAELKMKLESIAKLAI